MVETSVIPTLVLMEVNHEDNIGYHSGRKDRLGQDHFNPWSSFLCSTVTKPQVKAGVIWTPAFLIFALPYGQPKRNWKTLLNLADLSTDFRLHDLRRTMGSWQTITGSSTKIIGASLGHKTEQATAVYARLINKPIWESMERVAAEMQKKQSD